MASRLLCVTMIDPGAPIADRLADALRTGTMLDLIPDTFGVGVLGEDAMQAWGPSHDVDADLLRDLLLGRSLSADGVDPRGLRLRGARIRGRLDLDYVDTPVALWLDDCLLERGVTARQAHFPVMRMRRCRLGHPYEPAFVGDRMRIDGDLNLDRTVATAKSEAGALRLVAARVEQLSLGGATLRNSAGPALAAEALETDTNVLLDQNFAAEGTGPHGVVRLSRARIGGQLVIEGATMRNSTGSALYANGLQTGGGVSAKAGFLAEGAGNLGAVNLIDARISGRLDLSGAKLSNHSGPALQAEGLQTGSDVFLGAGLVVEGAGDRGAVRLLGARIGGQFELTDAKLSNPTGPALGADRLHTGGNLFFEAGFTAEGAGDRGAVRLAGAHISGQLGVRGALRNRSGPALLADRLQVGGDLLLSAGFSAEGAEGVIRLPDARVDGQLNLVGGDVRALSDPHHRWDIGGLIYRGAPQLSEKANRDAWLELLRTATPRYAAQPYQQLAAAYRAEGHDGDVRRILVAQRRDQIGRGGLGRSDRWWARITGVLLGYGYQPWRTLLYLAGVLAISVGLAFWLGGQGGLARSTLERAATTAAGASPPSAATVPTPCTLVQTIGRGLDLGAPFLPAMSAAGGSCQTTASVAGDALTVARWVLQLIVWALAALFIAGFTGIVRKT